MKTFDTMPPKHGGKAIPASRIVAVIQGWDVTAAEIVAQKKIANKSGANGCVVAFDKIDQGLVSQGCTMEISPINKWQREERTLHFEIWFVCSLRLVCAPIVFRPSKR